MANEKEINNLPEHFVKGLNKAVDVDTSGATSPIETILRDRMNQAKAQLDAKKPQSETRTDAPIQMPTVTVDGHPFYPEVMTMIICALVSLAKKDKELDSLLAAFHLNLKDTTGAQVYPFPSKAKTKKKK